MSFKLTEVKKKDATNVPTDIYKVETMQPDKFLFPTSTVIIDKTPSVSKEKKGSVFKVVYTDPDPHAKDGFKSLKNSSNDPADSFMPVPSLNPKFPHRISIFGRSGSGKSYWIARYVEAYHALFPDNKLYLLSRKENDPEFLHLPLKVIDPSKYIGTSVAPLSKDDLPKNSLIIMDDFETFQSKELKMVLEFRDDILKVGRAMNITVLMSSHVFRGGKITQNMYLESTHVVLFTWSQQLLGKQALNSKYGIDMSDLNRLYDKKERWLCIKVEHPVFAMTPTSLEIIG